MFPRKLNGVTITIATAAAGSLPDADGLDQHRQNREVEHQCGRADHEEPGELMVRPARGPGNVHSRFHTKFDPADTANAIANASRYGIQASTVRNTLRLIRYPGRADAAEPQQLQQVLAIGKPRAVSRSGCSYVITRTVSVPDSSVSIFSMRSGREGFVSATLQAIGKSGRGLKNPPWFQPEVVDGADAPLSSAELSVGRNRSRTPPWRVRSSVTWIG